MQGRERSDPRSLVEEAATLDAPSVADNNVAVAKVLLQVFPGGGAIAELISQIPTRRAERQKRFVQRLGAELQDIEEQLDSDFVRSEEFEGLVEDFLEKTARRSEMEKVDYYAAALAHSANRSRPDREDRERMVSVLEELRFAHLHLLALIATTTNGEPHGAMGTDQVIQHAWPDADLDRVKMDWRDLTGHNIVQSYPGGMMTPGAASNLSVRLTDFGRRFHEFIGPR